MGENDNFNLSTVNDYNYDNDDIENIEEHIIELIPGSRLTKTWLVLDNTWILVQNTKSVSGTTIWWECRYRRVSGCQYRLIMEIEESKEVEGENATVESLSIMAVKPMECVP